MFLCKCIKTIVQPEIRVPSAKITNPARVLTSHEHLQLTTKKEEREKKEARIMKEQDRLNESKSKEKRLLQRKKKEAEKSQAELKNNAYF